MEQYFKYLRQQFIDAKGIKHPDVLSKQFLQEFYAWVEEQKIIGEKYLKMLNHIGFDYNNSSFAEVGKGGYDSLAQGLDTKIITPYYNTFKVFRNNIIDGNVYVQGENPIIKFGQENTHTARAWSIKFFMTQNPYNVQCIVGWQNLANNGKNGVILGIYGNYHDQDRMKKLQILNAVKKSIWKNTEIGYDFGDNYYMYAIGSSNLKK